MKSVLTLLFTGFLVVPAVEASEAAHDYLTEILDRYEAAHQHCEEAQYAEPVILSNASRQKLNEYPSDDVSLFLMAKSGKALDDCTQPSFGELAIALHELAHADLQRETRQLREEVIEQVFSPIRWNFESRYQGLPGEMRRALESLPELQSPFDSLQVREQLGIK